ncbi:MAG TPA: M56 family metallopeptidase [Thermoanaerobaculia bacterium]|nr:M56 family metallopeptidase [Thermoanaerobaculia bacterium]
MSDIAVAYAINATWQAAAIAMSGLLLGRSLPPRQRFRLLALTLTASAMAPALTLVTPQPFVYPMTDAVAVPARGVAFIAIAYLIGLAFCALRLLHAAWHAWRIVAASTPIAPRRRVSHSVDTPVTIGGTVVLPAFVFADERLLTAALAHEDAHIRRRDYPLHLGLELLALPLYFHPVSHLLRRALAEAREVACDEEAAARYGRKEYAAALVDIAALTTRKHAAGMNMAATSIERRVETLLRPARVHTHRTIAPTAVLLAVSFACTRFDAAPVGEAALQGQWAMIHERSDLRQVTPQNYDAFTQSIDQRPTRVSVRQQRTRNGRTQAVAWSVIPDGVERPLRGEPGARGSAHWRNGQLVLRFTGPGAQHENATAAVRNGRLVVDGATNRGRYHAEFRRIAR